MIKTSLVKPTSNIDDTELKALSTTVSSANELPYYTGSGTSTVTPITSAGRNIIAASNISAINSLLGLIIGTTVQAQNSNLQNISSLANVTNLTSLATVTNLNNLLTIGNMTGHFSSGATGGGSDSVFVENQQTVTTNYTITAGSNAMSTGPITVNSGIVVTIPNGSRWVII